MGTGFVRSIRSAEDDELFGWHRPPTAELDVALGVVEVVPRLRVDAALALQPELGAFEAFADLVVGDVEPALDVPVQGVVAKLRLLPLSASGAVV